MSETVLVAAFVLVAGAIATLGKLLWNHVEHCKDVSATVSRIDTNLERVMKDIDKIGPRTHEAINAALSAKSDVVRLTDRLDRVERRGDQR